MKSRSCAFTGHRPGRYRFGYDEEDETCIQLKAALAEQIVTLIGVGVTTFYSGMALGADQWAASIVLNMRVIHPKVRLIAVLPCETQANKWSAEHRERYFNTLAECDDVITLNTHHTSTCAFECSRYLVDHADYLVAVYDNGLRGSTACIIRYAPEKRQQIISIHPDTFGDRHRGGLGSTQAAGADPGGAMGRESRRQYRESEYIRRCSMAVTRLMAMAKPPCRVTCFLTNKQLQL